jgi:tetratricopeptide (TPR) repeat protein
MARSYYQFGEYEKAMQAIQQMLQAAEDDGQPVSDYRVYNVLGNAQFALGLYDDALRAYQRSLDIAPANADNLDSIRQYYRYAQELSRAN